MCALATGAIPLRIGRYEPRKEIGRGTMGVVYEAWDPDLGRAIALKVVSPAFALGGRESYEQRFLTEARAAGRLSHPGIVTVHDVGRDPTGGLVYISLEYLVGETLDERLAGGALPWREALRIVGRVADAMHHAHTNGIVHRDIKPANIMVLKSGQPKVLDFGIARLDASQLTAPGEVFGTPLYMAPEQALGQPVDARSDIFSLGSVAYTALCGQAAFASDSVPAILTRIAQRDVRPPSAVVPGIPADADYCIARAMAKAPDDRYPDARMMAEDIDDIVAGRPPRHRDAWTAPAPGQRTLIAAEPGEATLPELELAPLDEAARRPARSALPYLFAALMASAAAYFYIYRTDWRFWRHELPKLASAARTYAGSVTLPPAEEAAASPAAAVVPVAPLAPSAVATVAPPAVPEPSPPAPSPSPARAEPAAHPAVVPSAYLVAEVSNEGKAATVEVWVDRARVVREKLDGRARRTPLRFSGRRGAPKALDLASGRHDIEVRMHAGGATHAARAAATFKAGATRRLDITVSKRGVPALRWQ
jgi:serine/threonine-protein kinase